MTDLDRRSASSAPGPVRIGPWEIDAAARVVSGPAGVHKLEPKPLSLLLLLASRPGQVVPRQDLLSAGWGSEMATDDVLSRSISELRRALGDDPRKPQFVETVRGAGYRLVVPEMLPPMDTAARAPETLDAHRAERHSSWMPPRWIVGLALGVAIAAIWAGSRLRDRGGEPLDPHLTPLTSAPGEATAPRLSPDGTRIAYTRIDPTQTRSSVYVEAIDGSQRLQVADAVPRALAWSADGSKLAFVTPGAHAIAEVSSLGGAPRTLLDVATSPILGLDWSVDGTIAFSSHDAPFAPFRLTLLRPDSLTSRVLTTGGTATVGDAYPMFSPDGSSIAFARFFTETSADVFLVNIVTRTETRLTFDARNITALAFAPDGQSITFASDRDGGSAVWRVSIAGGRPERVVGSDLTVTGLTYARGSSALIVAAARREQHLWTIPVGTTTRPSLLSETVRADGLPAFSPNDRRVAFLSDRSGAAELWMSSAAGDSTVQLTHGGRFASAPSWSPDGGRIVAERRASNGSELWIVDVNRRTSKRVPTTLRSPVAPTWSRDGRSIVVGSSQSGDWQIWRVPLDGGAPVRVTDGGGVHAVESVDGRTVFFTRPLSAGLWMRDLTGGQERLVVESVVAGDWTNWALGRDRVYFVARDSTGGQRLVAVPFASGRTEVIAGSVRVPMGTGGLTISHDERRLIAGQLDRREGNLYRVVTR